MLEWEEPEQEAGTGWRLGAKDAGGGHESTELSSAEGGNNGSQLFGGEGNNTSSASSCSSSHSGITDRPLYLSLSLTHSLAHSLYLTNSLSCVWAVGSRRSLLCHPAFSSPPARAGVAGEGGGGDESRCVPTIRDSVADPLL